MPIPKGIDIDPNLANWSDAQLERELGKVMETMSNRWGKAAIRIVLNDENPRKVLSDLGYSKMRHRENLHRMRTDQRFSRCCQILTEQYRRQAVITADQVRWKLWTIAKKAEAEGQFSSAVSAIQALNKMMGYNQPTQIESKVLHASIRLDGTSDSDIQMALDVAHKMIEEKTGE